jgi:hypothetical protein
MTALPPPEMQTYTLLGAEGFNHHGVWDGSDPRTIHGIHSQDWRHNMAKLYNHCDLGSRALSYGDFVASHKQLAIVVRQRHSMGIELGVSETDLLRADRQVCALALALLAAPPYSELGGAHASPRRYSPLTCQIAPALRDALLPLHRTSRRRPTAAASPRVAQCAGV